MQFVTGTVIGGKVILDGNSFPDGTVVTVLARESDETFDVPAEMEAELQTSIAEADRGDTISAAEMLRRLRLIA